MSNFGKCYSEIRLGVGSCLCKEHFSVFYVFKRALSNNRCYGRDWPLMSMGCCPQNRQCQIVSVGWMYALYWTDFLYVSNQQQVFLLNLLILNKLKCIGLLNV